ncbi:hypothetical protein PVAND_005891 [Polypedilum vanderplanki]|uniref:Uncharacterized protein n=1 Tax=Polypedilum vanderplanki TaxID=319348 RepID=A0A9J6C1I9_POLVA|nr:hypothetical protein PVAND_005891 [Polypedilum vanderplanki]
MDRFNYRPLEIHNSDSEINVREISLNDLFPRKSKAENVFAEGDGIRNRLNPLNTVLRIRDEMNIDLRARKNMKMSESEESTRSLNKNIYPIEEVTEDSDRSMSYLNERQENEKSRIQKILAENSRRSNVRPKSARGRMRSKKVIEIHKANNQKSDVSIVESEFGDIKNKINEVNSSTQSLIEKKSQQVERISENSILRSSTDVNLTDDLSNQRINPSSGTPCCAKLCFNHCFGMLFQRKPNKI